MGETAENKILSLLKQNKREGESESNKLLKLLRARSPKNAQSVAPVVVETKKENKAFIPPIPMNPVPASLPGLSALHLFGTVERSAIVNHNSSFFEPQNGWIRYFLAIHPLVSQEVAGLSHLPVNEDFKVYFQKSSMFLHKLLAHWRIKDTILPEAISMEDLDELLIRIIGSLKILIQQGKLQRVTWLDSHEDTLTLLCTLRPDSFNSVKRFLEGHHPSLFAHLAFLVEIMAHEVVTNSPGQLKEVILAGESLQSVREKLMVLVHRLAVRPHLGKALWEDNLPCTSALKFLFDRLEALFVSPQSEVKLELAEIKGGTHGLL